MTDVLLGRYETNFCKIVDYLVFFKSVSNHVESEIASRKTLRKVRGSDRQISRLEAAQPVSLIRMG